LETQENHIYLCCFPKVTFNKSHLGMCMNTRGHFINIKNFSWVSRSGMGKGTGVATNLPPLALHILLLTVLTCCFL